MTWPCPLPDPSMRAADTAWRQAHQKDLRTLAANIRAETEDAQGVDQAGEAALAGGPSRGGRSGLSSGQLRQLSGQAGERGGDVGGEMASDHDRHQTGASRRSQCGKAVTEPYGRRRAAYGSERVGKARRPCKGEDELY